MCALAEGDRVTVLDTVFTVIEVPGHTAGHIAYFSDALDPPVLFCGDTLFGCGCGRLFEGTPAQMLGSLDRLASLPGETRVYCAHEYTLANIRFALAVEPGNADLQWRARDASAQRERGEPTLPSTIGLELQTNPFMRSDADAVRDAAIAHAGAAAIRSRTDVLCHAACVEERLPLIRTPTCRCSRPSPRLGRCMNAHLIPCAGRVLLASALLLSPLAALAGDSDLFPGFTQRQ